MCGDYDSILGMAQGRADPPLPAEDARRARFEPATGAGSSRGLAVETDDRTGLATRVAAVRLGAHLDETWPHFWD